VIPREWITTARERIAAHTVQTPLTHDAHRGLFLKWENRQVTGSFKARGALNKVLSLEDWERAAGLVTASAGNHGQGVALAGRLTISAVEVFVPAHAVPSKVDSMRALGAAVQFVEGGYAEAESAARKYAQDEHRTFISPYNDGQVVAGQGTIALEIIDQLAATAQVTPAGHRQSLSDIACWIVPTGGGGLISACGAALADLRPRPMLIGVQPEASAFTHSLYHRNTQQDVQDNPTLADGLSGGIEDDSLTIPMMRRYVDDMLLVSEEAIATAIAFAWRVYREKIEGSAAVALAAALEGPVNIRPCVVILTGGNIQPEVFEEIVTTHSGQQWN
jgi:threonine dehydratase